MKFDEKIFQSETPLAFSEKELQILKILAEVIYYKNIKLI